jgi:hypothetical protein
MPLYFAAAWTDAPSMSDAGQDRPFECVSRCRECPSAEDDPRPARRDPAELRGWRLALASLAAFIVPLLMAGALAALERLLPAACRGQAVAVALAAVGLLAGLAIAARLVRRVRVGARREGR